ncbi:MAG TPA: hypothetical protein VHV78_05060, partial [Gemmatimonadaceae bacterium]|nr:hypothetical protein [Gemmatimonadaceae bacterium]
MRATFQRDRSELVSRKIDEVADFGASASPPLLGPCARKLTVSVGGLRSVATVRISLRRLAHFICPA